MLIREVMTAPAVRLHPGASLREAAVLLAESDASDLMVTDGDGRLVGVLSEGDVLRAVLPDLDEILGAGGSVRDALGALLAKGLALAGRPITPYVISDPITLHPDHHVGQAAVILVKRMIRRLPVVEEGMLVGTVSRGDVCRAVLRSAGP